jgi:hypothetical protein
MKMRKVMCLLAAAAFVVTAGSAAKAAECDANTIHVARLEQNVTKGWDKFWGAPETIGKTSANILAHVLMTETGAAVSVLDGGEGLISAEGRPDSVVAAKLLDGRQGCFLAFGVVDSALVYARNKFKFQPGMSVGVGYDGKRHHDNDKEWERYVSDNFTIGDIRRKFKIESKSRLIIFDRRTNSFVIDGNFEGTHETSVKEYQGLDKDKKFLFSANPSIASGSPLGIPFIRMFTEFSAKVKVFLGN